MLPRALGRPSGPHPAIGHRLGAPPSPAASGSSPALPGSPDPSPAHLPGPRRGPAHRFPGAAAPGTRRPNPYPTAPSAGQKGSCSRGPRGGGIEPPHLLRPPAGPLGISAGPQAAGSLPAGACGSPCGGCGGRGAWRAPGCWLGSPARSSVRGCPGQGAADLACDPRSQGTCGRQTPALPQEAARGRQTADLRPPGLEGTRPRCREASLALARVSAGLASG